MEGINQETSEPPLQQCQRERTSSDVDQVCQLVPVRVGAFESLTFNFQSLRLVSFQIFMDRNQLQIKVSAAVL